MDASLKQRLVGAAVLVALAVIFLPMLVKGPAPDSGVTGVSMKVPAEPKPESGTLTQDLPLVVPGQAPASGVSGMPDAPPVTPGEPAADTAPAAAAPLAAVAAGDYAVSFGNYASEADADKVIAALRAVGLPGYREPVTLAGKPAQRVRIGPFADRAVAESARLRAGQVRTDVDTRVVALDAVAAATGTTAPAAPAPTAPVRPDAAAVPPAPTPVGKPAATTAAAPARPAEKSTDKPAPKTADKPAAASSAAQTPKAEPPATAPANPASTGFVVQIGAFASNPDALAQRDALRKAGFNAFTDTVPGANGTLTRVRVGPVLTRAEAEALKARLKAIGKDGMVRPHP
ncbi:SPOR domain-containing protein [Thermomonas sp. S9]|uniref:SPOR domain-containing protein n=1 Tax=Thermomonas sp. S9 TaxID=2885203 RepID=UPI00216B60E4|nr:SPOR domain-containing protein [Thermomonas sp. S9]MCR6497177.1 SPOR domain-containing protein [Thermomonas sp. S9]